jgi:hypothetical protein
MQDDLPDEGVGNGSGHISGFFDGQLDKPEP